MVAHWRHPRTHAGARLSVPILTINSGSSSLKLGLYTGEGNHLLLTAAIDGIGKPTSKLTLTGPEGETITKAEQTFAHLHDAFDTATTLMQQSTPESIAALGHRIVHGGPHLVTHQRLTPQVFETLQASIHFAPLHIPPALELIRHTQQRFPKIPQFACFDTAFHQTMPPEAFTYPLPRPYRDAGVRRYGFHGLSYESIVHALGDAIPERTIVAHLGSGASACAMLHGHSVDTSMGLSPTGGFPMATRPGDLDPGILLLLERDLTPSLPALSPDALESLLNHESGLKALADESDMHLLLDRASAGDPDAALAVTLFCRDIAKTIGSYIAVLGGLDLLVFTGGIGEHSSPIRHRICDALAPFGITLDDTANETKSPTTISSTRSKLPVRVIPADENSQIARHVAQLR